MDTPDTMCLAGYRNALARDGEMLPRTKLGAGTSRPQSTRQLARSSSVRHKYGILLHALSSYVRPTQILELGTCLGVSSLYLLLGDKEAKLVSVEGCPHTYAKQRSHWRTLLPAHLARADFHCDTFDNFLENNTIENIDLAYIDGNHTQEATWRYFHRLWPLLSPNGLVVLDDIHWSSGMEMAWNQIKPPTTGMLTLDLWQFGLCMKVAGPESGHVVLKY
jgi:predicted O-methyltransferase YrrM